MPLPLRELHETLATIRRVHGVPWHHLIPDYLRYRRRLGAQRLDFLSLWLWDRRLPPAVHRTFLPDPVRVRFEYRMHPKAEVLAMRDKGRIATRLAAAGVPVAATVALAGPGPDDLPGAVRLRDAAALAALLGEDHPEGLVCKPNWGMAGRDVQVFTAVDPEGATHRDGERWDVARLWRMLSGSTATQDQRGEQPGWKIERRLAPHPALDQVHGPTLGCLRVVTFRRDDGRMQSLAPTWKIPVGRSGVDNLMSRPLLAAVDPRTGEVATPLEPTTMRWQADHPETGARLAGMVLPHVAEAMAIAERAAACFPTLRSLGHDIGITARGPVVIEVNPFWGARMMQAPHRRGLVQGDFAEFLAEIGATTIREIGDPRSET